MKHYLLYLASVICILIPVSAVRPMTSLFAEKLGASYFEVGLLTASYSLIPFVFAVMVGQFIDRFGEKLPLMIGALGMAASLSLPFLYPHLLTLFISQLLLGGFQLIALIAIQNGVTKSAPNEKLDRAIANLALCNSLGLMLGPLIGGYSTDLFGFQNSYPLFSAISLLAFLLALYITQFKRKGSKQMKQKQHAKDLLFIPGLNRTIIVSMLILASLDLFYVYYPLYGSSIGMSPLEIGWVLTIQGLASVVVRLFMPILVAKYGRVQVLSFFMLCGAIAFGSIPFFDIFTFIIFIAIFLGSGLGIVQPLTLMLTVHFAPKDRTAEVLGFRMAGNRLSQVICPIIFAGISNLIGLGAIFTTQAFVLVIGALFAKGINKDKDKIKRNLNVRNEKSG